MLCFSDCVPCERKHKKKKCKKRRVRSKVVSRCPSAMAPNVRVSAGGGCGRPGIPHDHPGSLGVAVHSGYEVGRVAAVWKGPGARRRYSVIHEVRLLSSQLASRRLFVSAGWDWTLLAARDHVDFHTDYFWDRDGTRERYSSQGFRFIMVIRFPPLLYRGCFGPCRGRFGTLMLQVTSAADSPARPHLIRQRLADPTLDTSRAPAPTPDATSPSTLPSRNLNRRHPVCFSEVRL